MGKQLDKVISSLGYKRYNKIAYGRTNDIFFNVRYINYNCHAQIYAFVKNSEGINVDQINLFLKDNRKRFKAKNANVADGVITVLLPSSTIVKAEVVEAFLYDFSVFLKEGGYTSSCTFCNSNENIGYTFTDGMVREVCPSCHDKLSNVIEDIKTERETSGSYLKGAIGAIIGGIIGIIPWVLLGMLGYVAAISGLIMAFLSQKGYMLFKGKVDKGMVWILILVMIVFTYVGVMFSIGAVVIQEYDCKITDLDIGILLTIPFDPTEDTGAVWGQLALGWLFSALGSYGLIKKASKHGSGKDLSINRISKDLNN